jgi:hypothetical protein
MGVIMNGMHRSCAEMGVLQRGMALNTIPEQVLQATQYKGK